MPICLLKRRLSPGDAIYFDFPQGRTVRYRVSDVWITLDTDMRPLEPRSDYEFAGHSNSVPLTAAEIPTAALEYAIVFTGGQEAVIRMPLRTSGRAVGKLAR